MLRIVRVWDEEYTLISRLEFLECRFVVDEGNDDLPILSDLRLFDEDEIPILDPLLIHGVTISTEEEVLLVCRDDLGRYWDLGLDILISEYRHTACYRTDEWDIANSSTICLERRRDAYLIMRVAIDPSLHDELIEHDRYRSGRCISES